MRGGTDASCNFLVAYSVVVATGTGFRLVQIDAT